MTLTWSRRRTLIAGLALIALTNAVALGGVAWNRSGEPESVLTLTQRELGLPYRRFGFDREGDGLELSLNWRVLTASAGELYNMDHYGTPEWLDRAKLASLGFDLSPRPDARRTARHYGRQLPREALVVLELDGPARQKALERAREREAKAAAGEAAGSGKKGSKIPGMSAAEQLRREETSNSRLFAVDVGLDAAELRAKYPDRARYTIVHANIRAHFERNQSGADRWTGYIQGLDNGTVNVPAEFRGAIGSVRHSAPYGGPVPEGVLPFQVTVAFGRRFEPWVVAAEAGAK
jgi:hypothetical protein